MHHPYHASVLTPHVIVPQETTIVGDHLTYHADLADHHVIDSHYVDAHASVPYHEHAYLTAVKGAELTPYEHVYTAHPTADYGGELHLGYVQSEPSHDHRIVVEE